MTDGMTLTFYWLVGIAILIVIVGYVVNWYFAYGQSALYTQGGSPVDRDETHMQDQWTEERKRALQAVNSVRRPH